MSADFRELSDEQWSLILSLMDLHLPPERGFLEATCAKCRILYFLFLDGIDLYMAQKFIRIGSWQRCYVHFLRNGLDYLPRNGDHDCLQKLRWVYERRNILETQEDLRIWFKKWGTKYPKLCAWIEDNIEETLSFYQLPHQHHKRTKSTNLLERVNQEIKRRSQVIRIFPNEESCLRIIRALGVEIHENWQEERYLNMNLLKEQKKNRILENMEVA